METAKPSYFQKKNRQIDASQAPDKKVPKLFNTYYLVVSKYGNCKTQLFFKKKSSNYLGRCVTSTRHKGAHVWREGKGHDVSGVACVSGGLLSSLDVP